jgi:hypothetical protein
MARAKRLEVEVLNPKKVKPDWELLYEQDNIKINRLIELYKENPQHARVIYKQGNKGEFQRTRVVAYTFANGDINVVQFRHSFGISVTNKMYHSEKNIGSIIYKKETNKWYVKRTGIKLLNYAEMTAFISNCGNYYGFNECKTITEFIVKRLPWLRNIAEDKYSVSHYVAFNTIISKKLFNVKSIYRHVFGIPYPVIEMMMKTLNKGNNYNYNPTSFVKPWKEIKRVLINVDNLKVEMFSHNGFMDACKMASSLNKKINCSWGLKRLIEEHDAWAKEISNVLLLNQKNTKMNIYHIYEDFAEYSGYELLRTNFDMVHDGLMMSHCVATYIDRVDRGICAIYKVDGYTMELEFEPVKFKSYQKHSINSDRGLFINQIRGYKNCEAPRDLVNRIQNMLDNFNNEELPSIKLQPNNKYTTVNDVFEMNDLPF